MKRAFQTSEMDDSAVKELMRLMVAHEPSPPENVHCWGKMLVHPKPGESFFSWLMRQAWAFGTTPMWLIQSEQEYWSAKENISLSLPQEWPLKLDVLPVSSAWEDVLRRRGLNVKINEVQLDISKWFDLTRESKITKRNLKNYYHYALRYCPVCWKDENNRYFKIIWRLPFVIVCPEHGVKLKKSCSSCGKLLFEDKRYRQSLVIFLRNFREKWLTDCRHCNHSLLDEVEEEKPELAGLQKQILSTLLSDSDWATPSRYMMFWHTYQKAVEKQKPDGAEIHLKLMDTILKKPPLISKSNYYSRELLAEIEKRLQAVTLYLSGTSAVSLAKKFGLTACSIQAFAEDLSEEKPIDEIIKRQFGYRGKLGLERAMAELRKFKVEHDRLPRVEDEVVGGMTYAIYSQEWVSFGIRKWNDLLMETFGEVNFQAGLYTGEQGLKRAVAEVQEYKAEHGRLPRSDEAFGGILGAISRGEWASFGIKKWNDLLMKAFGKINFQAGVYTGEKGLERAITELREFKAMKDRLPKCKEMDGIMGAIKRGEWVSFGIMKWNDLLRKTFGEINNEMRIYIGEQGLERAITELQAFKTEHNRLPKCSDKELNRIKAAIRHREWVSFGVEKWNDLLRKTFREVNIEMGIYTGERGLNLAMAEMQEFKAKYGRLPRTADKMFSGIIEAISRQEWVSFGIRKWNDLLRETFGEVNNEMGIYAGERGLKRAITELHELKAKRGRLPRRKDEALGGIADAAERGEWASFGIKKWNDLLRKAFGEVNNEMGIHTGERGLERAVVELRKFKKKHGRLPTVCDKEISSIAGAVIKGKWVSFGIKKWNDLLRKAFGEVNIERGTYTGERGLERAMAELRAFKTEHDRLPTSKEMNSITATIFYGGWVSFGIRKWNDLLVRTFEKVNSEKGIYIGERGLERAMAELQAFKTEHVRLPKFKDEALGGITDAVGRGEWISFGIKKWNDLLRKTFGEINNEWGVYIGEQGLERAMAELRGFKDEHVRLPTLSDREIYGIAGAVNRGRWVSFGIEKWNDLLRKAFGEVNNEMRIYTGERGLERAVAELRIFKTKYGRLPTTSDKEMNGIMGAVTRQEWDSIGIKKWRNLHMKVFGPVDTKMKNLPKKKQPVILTKPGNFNEDEILKGIEEGEDDLLLPLPEKDAN